ncbi:MAG: LamG domain-containing protein [Bacteroidetes bacterium]|nr:LamG domain-containing protein [Bacteroidota bacterium]
MKTIFNKNILIAALLTIGLMSCQKKFDPSSYAPKLNIGGYTSVKQIAASNLVGYWSFNSNLVDSVTNTAGTAVGTSYTTGFEKQSLQGALNGYVLATPGSGITNLQSFTSTLWINTPAPSTGIIGFFSLAKTDAFWGNIEMFFENGSSNTNGKLRIHVTKGGNDYTYAVDNIQNLFDKWNNIAFSYDASTSTCTLYINGASVSSGTINGLTGALSFSNVGKVVFGCVQFQTNPSQTSATTSQPWASYLTGQLDEVRIYNKALSAAEVAAIVALQAKGK